MFATKHKFCMLCAIRDITADHWSGKKRAYRPQQVHGHLGREYSLPLCCLSQLTDPFRRDPQGL
jgi:hypothetical protein